MMKRSRALLAVAMLLVGIALATHPAPTAAQTIGKSATSCSANAWCYARVCTYGAGAIETHWYAYNYGYPADTHEWWTVEGNVCVFFSHWYPAGYVPTSFVADSGGGGINFQVVYVEPYT